MKSIFKICRRYVVSACLFVAAAAGINLVVLMVWMLSSYENQPRKHIRRDGMEAAAAELRQQEDGGFVMGEAGAEQLTANGCEFAFLLDEDGNVVWDWQKPEEIPTHFSAGEIAAFSRWYLKDYPVLVWRYGDGGLFVLGYPKGSLVHYSLVYEMGELESTLGYIGIFFVCNAGLIFLLALASGYRFYRQLKPVGAGIDALAEGRTAELKERGMTQYLRIKINQASRLLEQQKKELERRDTARTEWIVGVSHDIRTPLSLIVGDADALERDAELSMAARKRAERIRAQSFVISRLVEDLNLTSKLSYHMQPLRLEKYVPAVWMRSAAAEMLNSGEISEAYELEIMIDPELEKNAPGEEAAADSACGCRENRGHDAESGNGKIFLGDVGLLTRALRNLLGNSVRHNPQGCRIRLSGIKTEDGFCICVEDSGKGVPEQVRRIIEGEGGAGGTAYEKNADSRPHVMGLFVVKQIACAHGGRLWFEKDGQQVWMSVRK